ncbi:hypothetical protein [Psychrobacter halodurans]|uniref:Uncharacterized protein n=1 Tax=Psychrobacter halodurans TaxID=2818439 RepID=A0AAW4IQN3_9GAMM|nr:hypothetical protein [Psychrobacter halodurans]MBO1515986.1 hypothetical protein [Psychrobacter halodurans]
MSIIVQAGHKTSKSKQVMEKLYERGLSRPNDSYTHNMTAEQVSETLYKVLVRENMSSTNEKMADNVMTDFLLANLDAENWGWESDKNLASLEYWQQIEPDVGFVLVFDHPSNVFKEFADAVLTTDMIDQAINEWVDYHQKMLETLETYEGQAILIEGSCAADNISKLGEQVQSIASGLSLKKHWQVFKDATDTVSDTDTANQSSAAIDHINNEILKKYPEVIKLFNTLLNKAAIKSSEPIYRTKQADLTELVTVLNDLYDKQENPQHSVEKELLVEQLYDVQNQLESQSSAHEMYKQQKVKEFGLLEKKLEEAKDSQNPANAIDGNRLAESLKQENEMLLKQLHRTQEELEKYYLKSQSLSPSKKNEQPQVTAQQPSKAPVYYGAADRVKNDLPYRLGAKMVKAKKPKDLAVLPLALFKEYQEFQSFDRNQVDLPDIEEYKDNREAEKVKSHLSYKLGDLFVSGMTSPKALIKMPFMMSREIREFKK